MNAFSNILVVCVGNICRSPTVEILLRQRLGPKFSVSSAGLGALVGKPIDPTAALILQRNGIVSDEHRARQLTPEMVAKADLILTMERGHVEAISKPAPMVRGKTFLVGKWNSEEEIPDPYKKSEEMFEAVYKLMEANVDLWVEKIRGA